MKLYILTGEDNAIVHISETLEYQENGNPLVDHGQLAIAEYLVKHTYELDESEVDRNKYLPGKYCYTQEQGFYKNPNWREFFSNEERLDALEETVNMLLGFEEE